MNIIYNKTMDELYNFKNKHFLKPKSDANKIRLYSCGPMESVKDFGQKWREELNNLLSKNKFSIFNPANEVKVFKEQKQIEKNIDNGFDICGIRKQFSTIIKIDLYEVLRSDIVLCNWLNDTLTAGTPGELTVAKIFKIPVLLICKDIEKTNKWVIGCTTNCVKDFSNIEQDIIETLQMTEK